MYYQYDNIFLQQQQRHLNKPLQCASEKTATHFCINPNCWSNIKSICQFENCHCIYQHENCERITVSKFLEMIQQYQNMGLQNSNYIFQWCLTNTKQFLKRLEIYERIIHQSETLKHSLEYECRVLRRCLIQGGTKKFDYPIGHKVFALFKNFSIEKVKKNQVNIEQKIKNISTSLKNMEQLMFNSINEQYYRQMMQKQAFEGTQSLLIHSADRFLQNKELFDNSPYSQCLKNLRLRQVVLDSHDTINSIFPRLQYLQVCYSKSPPIIPNIDTSKVCFKIFSANIKQTKIDCPELQTITLNHCLFNDETLYSLVRNCRQIKKFTLSSSSNVKTSAGLLKVFQKLVDLQQINLSKSNYRIDTISNNLKRLHTLSFSSCKPFDDLSISYFNQMPNLRTLQIPIAFSQDGSQLFFKNFPNVRNLTITSNVINDKLIMNICQNIKHLQTIKISPLFNHPMHELTNASIKYLSRLPNLKQNQLLFFKGKNYDVSPIQINCKQYLQQNIIQDNYRNNFNFIRMGNNVINYKQKANRNQDIKNLNRKLIQ